MTRVTTRYVTGAHVEQQHHRSRPGRHRLQQWRQRRRLGFGPGTGSRPGPRPGARTRAAARAEQRVVMRTHVEFPAFGTYGYLAVRRPDALERALRIARTVVDDVDATCSRFRADSDLARVNRAPGRWVEVDPLLVEAVRVAVRAAGADGRAGAPVAGPPLVTLGYDRDFRELRVLDTAPADTTPPPVGAWRSIDLDEPASASRPARRSTSARPRRPGPPTWSRPASSRSSASRPW